MPTSNFKSRTFNLVVFLFCLCNMSSAIETSNQVCDDDEFCDEILDKNKYEPATKLAKDKIHIDDVDTLIFHRNRMTTSRRTHRIHQLACVGGSAGCKLFTPNSVECERTMKGRIDFGHNWKCWADMSERVKFSHIEVICEGYDYQEDDHILLGSCGLEFALDYVSPLDHHENSYFQHMDEDEKEKHKERVKEDMRKKLDL